MINVLVLAQCNAGDKLELVINIVHLIIHVYVNIIKS